MPVDMVVILVDFMLVTMIDDQMICMLVILVILMPVDMGHSC